MPNDTPHGPSVPPHESLYRLITTPDWWVSAEQRPSSAAFDEPKFSVNIASLTSIDETVRRLSVELGRPKGGVVEFNCGRARQLGFDARLEADENYPANAAHAHVYFAGGSSNRKRNARRLAKECRTLHMPTF
jgi:hypothetical protein